MTIWFIGIQAKGYACKELAANDATEDGSAEDPVSVADRPLAPAMVG